MCKSIYLNKLPIWSDLNTVYNMCSLLFTLKLEFFDDSKLDPRIKDNN